MKQILEQRASARDNDYSHLEAIYHRVTGDELARKPMVSTALCAESQLVDRHA